MMCGMGFPSRIAKDFEYAADGMCGKTAPVGGWWNTFPVPFYKSIKVTVRADPIDGTGCFGGCVGGKCVGVRGSAERGGGQMKGSRHEDRETKQSLKRHPT